MPFMIPTLIFLLIRRFLRRHPGMIRKALLLAGRILLLLAIGIGICKISFAQNRELLYDVIRGGKTIGFVKVQCSTYDDKKTYKLESRIRARFILSFIAESLEEVVFQNGIVTYTSLYRKLNGDEKVSKKMVLTPEGYQVQRNGTKKQLSFSGIRNNVLSLYYAEPVDVEQVYSDNYQQYLRVVKMGDHSYKIIFPDGTNNEYHYRDGLCFAIDINHSIYRATVKLKN
jgi:hypothetical protein